MLRGSVKLVGPACVQDAQTLALDCVVDELVGVSLKAYGVLAGKLEQPRLRVPLQAQQRVAAVVQHLGRRTLGEPAEHGLHDDAEVGADAFALDDVVGWRAHAERLAVGGHVRRFRGVFPRPSVPVPAPDELAVRLVYLHQRGCVDDRHLEADVLVGDGVVVHVASEIDAAVLLDRQLRVELHLVSRFGQRHQVRFLDGQEQLLARLRALVHAPLVALPHLLGDGRVQLLYGIERLVAQGCDDPAVEYPHMVFHSGFVLGVHGPRGDGHAAVVVAEVVEKFVEHRHAVLPLDDGRLQVVRHQNLRHTADVLEEPFHGRQEVLHPL